MFFFRLALYSNKCIFRFKWTWSGVRMLQLYLADIVYNVYSSFHTWIIGLCPIYKYNCALGFQPMCLQPINSYYKYLCSSDSSHVTVMSLAMCAYPICRLWSLLMWPEAKKDSHPTSQIKAVIVTLSTTKANERHIGYRNKHVGDTGGVVLQWECGNRPWGTLFPVGRPSTVRNLGMGQGACRCLVLKTNLGPVIHKSLVYQWLQTLLCTFHESDVT